MNEENEQVVQAGEVEITYTEPTPDSSISVEEIKNVEEHKNEKPEIKENVGWTVPSNPSGYGKSTAPWNGASIGVDAPDSIFLFVNSELPPSTGRVCPHHESTAPHNVNRRGVIAAYAAVKGARGGIRSDIPADVRERGLSHLRNHYSEFDLNWPEEDEALNELINEFFEPSTNEVDTAKLEKEILLGLLEKEKLVNEIIDKVEYSKDELMSFSKDHLEILKNTVSKIKIPEPSGVVVKNERAEEIKNEEITIGDLYSKKRGE
jgi:hypothetical protein